MANKNSDFFFFFIIIIIINNTAFKGCFEQDPQFLVSEPKKLRSKMTVVGIPVSLLDGEIIANITKKNQLPSSSL